MFSFKEFLRFQEELWSSSGPQDNPSNPGTKRKDAKDPYNHRFGTPTGGGFMGGMPGQSSMQPMQPQQQQFQKMKKMKSR